MPVSDAPSTHEANAPTMDNVLFYYASLLSLGSLFKKGLTHSGKIKTTHKINLPPKGQTSFRTGSLQFAASSKRSNESQRVH